MQVSVRFYFSDESARADADIEEGTSVATQSADSETVNRNGEFGLLCGGVRWLTRDTGLSRTAIFTSVAASLKRLDTDYIDVLQIHRYDASTPPEETMRALHDLVTSGK